VARSITVSIIEAKIQNLEEELPQGKQLGLQQQIE
jgi:hypothetical protein